MDRKIFLNILGQFFIFFAHFGKNTEISMKRLRFHSCLCGLEQVLLTSGKGRERKKNKISRNIMCLRLDCEIVNINYLLKFNLIIVAYTYVHNGYTPRMHLF